MTRDVPIPRRLRFAPSESHHVRNPGAWMGAAIRCVNTAVLASAVAEANAPFDHDPVKYRRKSSRRINPWREFDEGGKRGPWQLRTGDVDPGELVA